MQHSSVVAFDGRKERASPLLLFLVLGPVEIGQVIKKLQLVINKMENFTQLPTYNGDEKRPGNVSHKQKEDYRQQMPWCSKEAYLDMACDKDQ